jgi:hypothetical protein
LVLTPATFFLIEEGLNKKVGKSVFHIFWNWTSVEEAVWETVRFSPIVTKADNKITSDFYEDSVSEKTRYGITSLIDPFMKQQIFKEYRFATFAIGPKRYCRIELLIDANCVMGM